MLVRKLDVTEHEKTRRLYQEVFAEDSDSFVDYYYKEKTSDNQIYVVEEDGDIQAMIHLNPYTVMVNDQAKTIHYIVAVATRKEYRRKGYMGMLLQRVLQDMYENGESFTFLMPAAEAIYTPYDFRTVYEQERNLSESGEPRKAVLNGGVECKVTELSEDECAELSVWANEKLASEYQVYALRSEAYYRRLKKEYASDGAKLMIYRDDKSIRDVRPWIPDELSEEKPKIMIRPLDVRRLLMSVRLKSLTAVCFTVVDPVIEENNRCVVITGTEYSGVMLMDGKPENSEGEITVAALGSFLFGAKTVDEICEEVGVKMTERMKYEMTKIQPLSRIYLNEVV